VRPEDADRPREDDVPQGPDPRSEQPLRRLPPPPLPPSPYRAAPPPSVPFGARVEDPPQAAGARPPFPASRGRWVPAA
jgi:putative peptidoglycan lipid II flippase